MYHWHEPARRLRKSAVKLKDRLTFGEGEKPRGCPTDVWWWGAMGHVTRDDTRPSILRLARNHRDFQACRHDMLD